VRARKDQRRAAAALPRRSRRLDPNRLRASAELAVFVEERGAGFVFAALRGDVPTDHAAWLVNVNQAIDMRRELAE
jgi:hypothetical protein